MKNEVSERAGHEANAAHVKDVPQENITFCAHRGHGCISQNGYMCTLGSKCQPCDEHGRRFVVFEWIEGGQRLATRHYLDDVNGRPLKPVAPVIDAEQANAALVMVERIRGRAA